MTLTFAFVGIMGVVFWLTFGVIGVLFFFLSMLEDSGYMARVPFVMELPNYRMLGIKNVLRLLWEKAKDFLERAFTVIIIATIVIW